MKTETDKFKLAVLDGRQLALKVSANRCGSAYLELCCSHVGVPPCPQGIQHNVSSQRHLPILGCVNSDVFLDMLQCVWLHRRHHWQAALSGDFLVHDCIRPQHD